MLANYLKIAFRNLLKNPTYSFINITGLSVGISCCLLISLWVYDEVTYDRFIPKVDRLYEVNLNLTYDGKVNTWSSLPLALETELKPADAAIVNAAVTTWRTKRLLTVDDRHVARWGYAASENFLEMFGYRLLKGSPAQVLDDPFSILLTASTARVMFNDEDPMGKVVRVDDEHDLKVTGILEDHPKNSSFSFDYIVPFSFLERTEQWIADTRSRWDNYNFPMFVELRSSSDKDAVEAAIKDIVGNNTTPDGIKRELFLHRMDRWRLHASFENGMESGNGMIQYVKAFSLIAAFILCIACVNFMNLATARSEKRAREVGIRKSIGSNRKELILQFLGEALMMAAISFSLAVMITELALPFYNVLVNKQLHIDYTSTTFWAFTAGVVVVTGLLSGSYPAFYLSSFRPAHVLKGVLKTGVGAIRGRQVLVVMQFGFSILLIVGTIVVVKQVDFIKGRDLGYQQENLVTIPSNKGVRQNMNAIREALLQSGVVEAVTTSNSAITEVNSTNFVGWPGKPADLNVSFGTIGTNYDYARTMGIKLVAGRDFSPDFPGDSSAVIVNQAAIDLMGLTDPIGEQLDIWNNKRTVIGVFENALMESPFEPVRPMYFVLFPNWASDVTLRLKTTTDLSSSIKKVEHVFAQLNPAYPFEYKFVDEEFGKKFSEINLISRLVGIFSTLALVITGLGLFGLAAFTAEQRTKEIGIRKALGASVNNIVTLLSRDFTTLVVAGFVVAGPLAWWLVDNFFLSKYTFRTELSWWIVPLAGVASLLFALIIVSTQALRAARSNPVVSLRSE